MALISLKEIKYIALLILANTIITLPYFLYSPKQALMAILILSMVAMLNKTAFIFISLYSILINAFFLHLVPKWGAGALGSRIQAAFESASYETSEYFNIYVGITDIILLTSYIAIGILGVIFIANKILIKKQSARIFLTISSIMIGLSLLIYPTLETLKNFQLVHLPLTVITTQNRLKIINQRQNYLQAVKKNNRICDSSFNNIIFIQGESVNKNHMSLYGYHRKTTPFLDSIKPFAFNAISPSNQTRFSMALEFTPATVENYDLFYHSTSMVTSLAECGYETYWISNQGKRGEFDTTVTSIAKEADHTYFLNDMDYTTAGLDETILKVLDSLTLQNDKKQAFFIHLLGSHFSYAKRYPQSMSIYGDKNIIDQYDNSIFYTDYIISEINKRFTDKSTVFVYLSDHGEIVDSKKHGHGYTESTKDEYEVPLVIWSNSDSVISPIYNKLKTKTINTQSINSLIENLAGVRKDLLLSFSNQVMSLEPGHTSSYEQLNNYSIQSNEPKPEHLASEKQDSLSAQ